MDKVIETLYSIEERARRIIETTNNEKIALKESYDKQKSQYEAQVNETIASRLTNLEDTLKEQYDAAYQENTEQTKSAIEKLDEHFKHNHSQIAQSIFKQIIEA